MSVWCEFCRDHYEVSHFGHHGYHLVGTEWGPTGRSLAIEKSASALVEAFKRLAELTVPETDE